MPDCPPDADLSAFLNEALPAARVPPVAAHVDRCPACQDRLDRLTRDDSGAVARYKHLSSAAPDTAPPAGTPEAPLSGVLRAGLPRVPGFDVYAEIGRGGMGVVYKARHRRLNRPVALKMILAGAAAGTRAVQRFLFEAEALARIQDPQVVQVFEVDTYQGPGGVPVPYLAMELLEGGSLARRLRGGPLPPRDAAELIEGVARAVHAAHLQGVVHRDLKPGNILFGGDDGGRMKDDSGDKAGRAPGSDSPFVLPPASLRPKVTDFGLAKFVEAGADLTGSGQVLGTPHYMAPEQAAGGKPVGPAADVYALGAILFECLTGRPPFEGDEPVAVLRQVVDHPPPDVRDLRPEVPRDLAAVAARCLRKEPARRYATAADLADDLRRFLDGRPTAARPVGPAERAWLWTRRNPTVAGLLVMLGGLMAAGVGLVAVLLVLAFRSLDNEREAKRLAWQAVGEAERSLAEANRQRANAERAKQTADRRGAELEFARAVQTCEEGRVRDGLGLFDAALDLADAVGDAALARAARANRAAWARELPPPRRSFPHRAQPRLAAFHPDGRRMVTVGREGEAYLWDLETGRKDRTYARAPAPPGAGKGPGPEFRAVAVSPDGRTVAAGGTDGRVTVWGVDWSDPRDSFPAADPAAGVWGLGFTRDGALWATDGATGVRRWDLSARPKPAATHLTPAAGAKAGAVTALAVAADGRRVFTGDQAGVIREWDAGEVREGRRWPAGGAVTDLAVSPDGARLAATGPAGVVRVIDLADDRPPLDIDLGGTAGTGVAFAPAGPLVLAADADGAVRAWDRDTGLAAGPAVRFPGEVGRPRGRPGAAEFAVPAGDAIDLGPVPVPPGEVLWAGCGLQVRGLDVCPARGLVAVADDTTLDVLDLTTRRVVQALDPPVPGPAALRFDPDPASDRLFRGYPGGLDWVAVPGGRVAEPVPVVRPGRVGRIAFARGGLVFADEARVTRCGAADLRPTTTTNLTGEAPTGVDIRALAARPDGGELLAAYGDRVEFLDPDTLRPVRAELRTGKAEVLDAVYTPDGAKVFLGRRDGVAELRDAESGRPVARPMPHPRAVAAVAVSADGKLLLTGCRDGTARFWDAATGLPLGAPLRHPGAVTHVAFAPGDTHAVTGTSAGHVVTWAVPPPG